MFGISHLLIRRLEFRMLAVVVTLTCLVIPAAMAQNGWRMEGFNTQRTNSSPALGPATRPSFQMVISNSPATLSKTEDNGDLILLQSVVSYRTGKVMRYTNSGSLIWELLVPTDPYGLQDVAIGESGTIYAADDASVSAIDPVTHNLKWTRAAGYDSNEMSRLAVSHQGGLNGEVVFHHSGYSFVGGQEVVLAVRYDGEEPWPPILLDFRGYTEMYFGEDESRLYLFQYPGYPYAYIYGFDTATGLLADISSCNVGYLVGVTPWNTVLALDGGSDIIQLPPDLSYCTAPLIQGDHGEVQIITTGQQVVTNNTGDLRYLYTGFSSDGTRLWTSPERLSLGISDGNNIIYAVAPLTNEVVAIAAETGVYLWRYQFPDFISRLLLGGDGNLYVQSGNNVYQSRVVTSHSTSLPIVFVEGFCADPESWEATRRAVRTKLQAAYPGKYDNNDNYYVFYDRPEPYVTFELEHTRTPQHYYELSSDERSFVVAFRDPNASQCVPWGAACYEDFDPSNVAEVEIEAKAWELANVIWRIKQVTNAPSVMLVSHSMGGLVARAYMEGMGGTKYFNDVAELATLDTPHNGSDFAGLDLGGGCPANPSEDKREMVPDSAFMRLLNYSGDNGQFPDPLLPGSHIDSIKSYWTVNHPLQYEKAWTDDVLGLDTQDLAETLGGVPPAHVRGRLGSLDNQFVGPDYPSSGCWETFPPGILHMLHCVGQDPNNRFQQSQTVENIVALVHDRALVWNDMLVIARFKRVRIHSRTQIYTRPLTGGRALWSIQEGSNGGKISGNGIYTAPNYPGVFHIIAFDGNDPRHYGLLTVTVTR